MKRTVMGGLLGALSERLPNLDEPARLRALREALEGIDHALALVDAAEDAAPLAHRPRLARAAVELTRSYAELMDALAVLEGRLAREGGEAK